MQLRAGLQSVLSGPGQAQARLRGARRALDRRARGFCL